MNITMGIQRDHRDLAGAPGAGDTTCVAVNKTIMPNARVTGTDFHEESNTIDNVKTFIVLYADRNGGHILDRRQLVGCPRCI